MRANSAAKLKSPASGTGASCSMNHRRTPGWVCASSLSTRASSKADTTAMLMGLRVFVGNPGRE